MDNISQEDKTKIVQLIQSNLTPLDNFINMDYEYYDIKKYKGLIMPTITAVNNTNANFTKPFLSYIDIIVKGLEINKWTNTIAYIISGLFVPFNIPSTFRTEPFPTIDKPYPFAYYYSPVNRLYFLFLVNLYCNYQNYVKEYKWLYTHFLSLCDQIGLTGIFAIKQTLYNELCGDCDETSRGVGEVNDGYFLLSNSSIRTILENIPPEEEKKIRDNMSKFIASSKKKPKLFKFSTQKTLAGKTQKTLAGKTLASKSRKSIYILPHAAVVAAAASVASGIQTPCAHGKACYRQGNSVHTTQYSHPIEEEDESTVDVDYSTAGGAKRKTHKKKQTHKKRKTHNKNKTNKNKTNKRK